MKRRKSDSDGGLDDQRELQLIDFSPNPKKMRMTSTTEDDLEGNPNVEIAKNYDSVESIESF